MQLYCHNCDYVFHKLNPLTFLFTEYMRAVWKARELAAVLRCYAVLLTTTSRPALGPSQLPMQWVPGVVSQELNRPGREAYHSRPSTAEVQNAWIYTSTPQYAFIAWCSVK